MTNMLNLILFDMRFIFVDNQPKCYLIITECSCGFINRPNFLPAYSEQDHTKYLPVK